MRKIIVSMFLVVTVLCSLAMSITADDWIKKLDALWDGKKYTDTKKAIECLNNIIKLKPNESAAYYNRGVVYGQTGEEQRAIADYNQAIRLKPDLTQAYINKAVICLSRGDKKQGCPAAQKACKLGQCQLFDMAKVKGYCKK